MSECHERVTSLSLLPGFFVYICTLSRLRSTLYLTLINLLFCSDFFCFFVVFIGYFFSDFDFFFP